MLTPPSMPAIFHAMFARAISSPTRSTIRRKAPSRRYAANDERRLTKRRERVGFASANAVLDFAGPGFRGAAFAKANPTAAPHEARRLRMGFGVGFASANAVRGPAEERSLKRTLRISDRGAFGNSVNGRFETLTDMSGRP